nr:V-type ATP synthase subunit B [Phytohabitans flavus]
MGTVSDAGPVEHRVLVPPGVQGRLDALRPAGRYQDDEPVATIDGTQVALTSWWPVRKPRPYPHRLPSTAPLVTGQRVLDAVFPILKGGAASVPGGFGTGKTVLLQQIAKWCDADVIVYVGCGERGNELADVLAELAQLTDPRTGGRLADRTVTVANTSNMPIMAREASIYTGVTVAEYYRDMGYDTVVIADSTSRWAEALREFASRIGALPAEEGYPAGLASALAAFYERAGRVAGPGGREGSVTIVGAVSPPGGDLTEPVTAHTQRFVRTLWTLDRDLANARHYPAVSWSGSYSRDSGTVGSWYAGNGDPGWAARASRMVTMLAEADRLAALADLVGAAALPGPERVALLGGRLLREAFLQQNALSPNDAFCAPTKSAALADLVFDVVDRSGELVAAGRPPGDVENLTSPRDPGTRGDRPCRRGRCPATPRRRTRRAGRAMTPMPPVEYSTIDAIRGPLLVVRGVTGVGWDEFVRIRLDAGPPRHGVVLDVDHDIAIVEVLEGTDGMDRLGTHVAFNGSPFRIPVGDGWLGRVCNGRGEPIDDGPPVLAPHDAPVAGNPLNPTLREPPAEPVLTGVSAIDGLTTLVRGQKLPIFSVAGLPHLELATQIAAQSSAGGEPFSVVVAGMGLPHADAATMRAALEDRARTGDLLMVLNTADDPVVERILTPRIALTVAEHLAFTLGRHVLVVAVDMTSYCEAVREVSSARGEIPARRAYPGYLYSDLASLYERCGRIRGRPGSLTIVPVLTMPAGDITHPVPDLTGYITEGQVVLSAQAQATGGYPPVDPLSSLSRLMRHGAGPGRTRDDHLAVAGQMLASLARARTVQELTELIGTDALNDTDRTYLAFTTTFTRDFATQRPDEQRALPDTLDRAWQVLAALPRRELTMLPTELLDTRLPRSDHA